MVAKIVKRWRITGYLSEIDQRRMTCALQNMRMSCNSTYLLDQESDHGVKADELAALLDDLFVQPDAKAVIFSQWTRSHDIVIRRLKARGIGHVSFHGGIPSEKRPALVERFMNDADCRVFISTDAGAAGLNLQNASTLINMDLPWNPAILEQRISRIHRMGQKRPVQIVNLVAKGTIEEGMLGVLAFKRSLSAGILDGGNGEVSLGGSRLTRFMKEMEKVTGQMHTGESDVIAPAEEMANVMTAPHEPAFADAVPEADTPAARGSITQPPPAANGDPWQALAQVGAQLMAAFGAANTPAAAHASAWLERDPKTGAQRLAIPLPPPETAARIADALTSLATALRGRI